MAANPFGSGYWLVAADGGVFAFGDARFFGSMGGRHLNEPIVGMAADPFRRSATGWWPPTAGCSPSATPAFLGSMGGQALTQPVVGMAATPSGRGYWLVASDGGVFAFGDAGSSGRWGDSHFPTPSPPSWEPPTARGYWLLPTTPRAADWAVPGTVIYNLDTAPGSPYKPGQKVVALTFDDGPSPIYTPQVLQILVADHVPASFQIIGQNGAAYPDLLRQEAADGMSLVNHTWTHVDLTTLAPSGWTGQVDQTNSLLQSITGHPVRCLRPPYGYTDSAVVAQLGQRGLAELYWDVDPSDYLMPGASVIAARAALSPPSRRHRGHARRRR